MSGAIGIRPQLAFRARRSCLGPTGMDQSVGDLQLGDLDTLSGETLLLHLLVGSTIFPSMNAGSRFLEKQKRRRIPLTRMRACMTERRCLVSGPSGGVQFRSTARCNYTELSVVTTSRVGYEVVTAAGTLNGRTATQLREVVYGLLTEPEIALDISKISCCDFAGLTVLVNTLRDVYASGGSTVLVDVQPELLRLLHAIGLAPANDHLDEFAGRNSKAGE